MLLVQTVFRAALVVAALVCAGDLLLSFARFVRSVRTRRPVEFPALGRRWIPIPELGFGTFAFCFTGLMTLGLTDGDGAVPVDAVLLAAVLFGYAGAVLSRAVRTPGAAGRRFGLRVGLLLGLPAVFGLMFGLSDLG